MPPREGARVVVVASLDIACHVLVAEHADCPHVGGFDQGNRFTPHGAKGPTLNLLAGRVVRLQRAPGCPHARRPRPQDGMLLRPEYRAARWQDTVATVKCASERRRP